METIWLLSSYYRYACKHTILLSFFPFSNNTKQIDEDYKENSTFKSACHKVTTHSSSAPSAGKWGSPGEACDAPVALAEQTLEWISKEWVDKLDFVLWTGDNAK